MAEEERPGVRRKWAGRLCAALEMGWRPPQVLKAPELGGLPCNLPALSYVRPGGTRLFPREGACAHTRGVSWEVLFHLTFCQSKQERSRLPLVLNDQRKTPKWSTVHGLRGKSITLCGMPGPGILYVSRGRLLFQGIIGMGHVTHLFDFLPTINHTLSLPSLPKSAIPPQCASHREASSTVCNRIAL